MRRTQLSAPQARRSASPAASSSSAFSARCVGIDLDQARPAARCQAHDDPIVRTLDGAITQPRATQ
jgi:hypothetical protein